MVLTPPGGAGAARTDAGASSSRRLPFLARGTGKRSLQSISVHGACEVVTLADIATQQRQLIRLRDLLDALGYGFQTKCAAKLDDCAGQRRALRLAADAVDE